MPNGFLMFLSDYIAKKYESGGHWWCRRGKSTTDLFRDCETHYIYFFAHRNPFQTTTCNRLPPQEPSAPLLANLETVLLQQFPVQRVNSFVYTTRHSLIQPLTFSIGHFLCRCRYNFQCPSGIGVNGVIWMISRLCKVVNLQNRN